MYDSDSPPFTGSTLLWLVSESVFLGLLRRKSQNPYVCRPNEHFPMTENFSAFQVHCTVTALLTLHCMFDFIMFGQIYTSTESIL